MPVFVWEGRSRTGDVRSGEVEATSASEVEQRLRAQQITADRIKKKPKEITLRLPGSSGVKTRDLVIFTRQFSTMIDAGLPIVQALDLLQGQEPNVFFRGVIKDIKNSVETGSTLAEALKRHPRVFDSLYVNLVAAGEAGGILDGILARLAVYIEKAAQLKRKIKGAMTYPVIVLIIAVLVIIVMLWKVIPTFQEMFSTFGDAELPGPTQFVIDLSEGFQANLTLIMGSLAVITFGVPYALRQRPVREVFDRFILKTPIIGEVLRKSAVARFTRTFGTMVASGVPILDALDIVARSSGNYTIEKAILYTAEKIAEGKTLVEPLLETKVFPEMVVQMIGVGEATGALDTMLNKIADFYEEEVDVAVDALTAMIEPLMMVFIGGVVGGLLIAMYLPIFGLADTVKGM